MDPTQVQKSVYTRISGTRLSHKQNGKYLVTGAVWIFSYRLRKTRLSHTAKRCWPQKNAPVQDLFTACNNRHFLLSWLDPSDPAQQKEGSNGYFPPHKKQVTGLYRNVSIYDISTYGPSHINVTGKWPKPALQTLETAQLRPHALPQDVSKHVSAYADIFTSWLSAVNVTNKRGSLQSVLFPSETSTKFSIPQLYVYVYTLSKVRRLVRRRILNLVLEC